MGHSLTRFVLPFCLFASITSAQAQAERALMSPAEAEPVKIGWIQGTPPPSEKRILFRDGNFCQFPKTRWSFAHRQQLMPTARIARGKGPLSALSFALRKDLDEITSTPTGQRKTRAWDQAFVVV